MNTGKDTQETAAVPGPVGPGIHRMAGIAPLASARPAAGAGGGQPGAGAGTPVSAVTTGSRAEWISVPMCRKTVTGAPYGS